MKLAIAGIIATTLALSVICSNLLAAAKSPDGKGIDEGKAKSVDIAAGQALKVTVDYSAKKEVQAMIWYSDNNSDYPTRSNAATHNGPHDYTVPEQGKKRTLLISGWYKNCYPELRHCAKWPWIQAPFKVFSKQRTIGFEDADDQGTAAFDDIRVTITCLNDKTECPVFE